MLPFKYSGRINGLLPAIWSEFTPADWQKVRGNTYRQRINAQRYGQLFRGNATVGLLVIVSVALLFTPLMHAYAEWVVSR